MRPSSLTFVFVSSIFNTAHGAGETIRGNINSFLDQGGEALAGGSNQEQAARQSSTTGGSGQTTADHDSVAQNGLQEIKSGLNQLGGGSGSTTSSTGASSTNTTAP